MAGWGKKFNSRRDFVTTLGVVEFINAIRGSHNASYAWITTEKDEEISIKLAPSHEVVAGQLVSLTQSFSDKAYRLHSTEIEHPEPVPILGTAKYVNRTDEGGQSPSPPGLNAGCADPSLSTAR